MTFLHKNKQFQIVISTFILSACSGVAQLGGKNSEADSQAQQTTQSADQKPAQQTQTTTQSDSKSQVFQKSSIPTSVAGSYLTVDCEPNPPGLRLDVSGQVVIACAFFDDSNPRKPVQRNIREFRYFVYFKSAPVKEVQPSPAEGSWNLTFTLSESEGKNIDRIHLQRPTLEELENFAKKVNNQ